MSDLNFGGGGSSSSGSGSTTTIIILLAVCCCCSLSIGVPIGFYFLDPTFKDWVNGLFNKNNSTTAAADTGGDTGPTPTGVPCGDGVTYAATAALCPTSGPSGTTDGSLPCINKTKPYAPMQAPGTDKTCTYTGANNGFIQFDPSTCAGMCAMDNKKIYQSTYHKCSYDQTYSWDPVAKPSDCKNGWVKSPEAQSRQLDTNGTQSTDLTKSWVCPDPNFTDKNQGWMYPEPWDSFGGQCTYSTTKQKAGKALLPADAIAGKLYKSSELKENSGSLGGVYTKGFSYAACGSKTNKCNADKFPKPKK